MDFSFFYLHPIPILLLGLILILLEFYIPGAILGIIGGILVIFSILIVAVQSNSPTLIVLFSVGALVGLMLVVKFAIWRITKNKAANTIYLDRDQEGYQASSFDKSTIGKEGIVVSDLKLSGFIQIEGKRYQAISQAGYIPKGLKVLVIGGQGAYLVVKQSTKENS